MDRIDLVLLIMVISIVTCIVGGLAAESISVFVRRRVPSFWFEGESVLLWGLALLAAFSVGLMIMYLALEP